MKKCKYSCYEIQLEYKLEYQKQIIDRLSRKIQKLKKKNKQLEGNIKKAKKWINNHTMESIDEKFKVYNEMISFDEYANPLFLLNLLDKGSENND